MSQTKKTSEKKGKSTLSTEEVDLEPTTKECLKEISSKLSTVVDTLNKLNDTFNDWKEQTAAKTVQSPDTNFGALGSTLGQIKDVLEKISLPRNETTVSGSPEASYSLIEDNALRIKNKISAIWENNVRSRRLLYWQSLRNKNIAMKHETWLQEDNIILPQWLQMKNIPNEPENVTKRREKQVLDSFKTENELLLLRSESQETKYKDIDTKMMTEIEKQATGQSRNYLTNMWQEDCRRNEEISKKRWQNKNLIWLNKYEENFRTKYQNKNPFIKEPDETDRSKTYAEISAEQPKARRQRPNPAEKQRQEGGQNKDTPSPQRTTGGRRNTQLEGETTRQTYPRQYQENPTLSNRNTTDGNDDIRNDNSTQVTFLGRGQGRGRGRGQGQVRTRGRGRRPQQQ